MSGPALVGIWIVVVGSLLVIIRQHAAYLRRSRPLTFGAFLETAGWIIILLVALGALYGGVTHPGTRVVEISAGLVGVLLIAVGSLFR